MDQAPSRRAPEKLPSHGTGRLLVNLSSISVIIPAYQCADRLPEHIECLRLLRPMVHEFIWVTTESPDRSHEIAREAAKELGGQVLEVPRGLYQAWNSGIARATGEFIYISTIGDTITPEGLNALSVCIRNNQADVVFSPPVIFPMTKVNLKSSRHWTVFSFFKVLKRFAGVHVPKEKAMLLQILSGASGLLGSCASCLFRTSFLQSRPFPTEYFHYGDTAWTYQHLSEAILAFYPDPVARFIIHDVKASRIVNKSQVYHLSNELGALLPQPLNTVVQEYIRASIQIDNIRDPHPRFGWWWMREAWEARVKRSKMQTLLLQALQ
jgi:glycosyltransferase involved in cell wall biosynthesis